MEKSIFNFKIQYLDGSIIDLNDLNLWVSSFHIKSPEPNHSTDNVEGQNGSIYLGTTLKDRNITSTIMIEGVDSQDFDLFRDQVFMIFNPLEKFYIIRDLQPAKRMLVSVNNEFDISYLSLEDGQFDIEFIIHSVFIESIGTTLDPFTFDSELWQIGEGLVSDDDLKYSFSSNSFSVFNAGVVAIDPSEPFIPLVITYKGASNNLTITNKTTGDKWTLTGTTNASDTLVLDGVKSTVNSLSVFRSTNHKLITLAPGWNDFELTGTSGSFTITFDFRFYYF